MSLIHDIKHARLLSCRLEKFSDKGRNVFNFRCPICGDSNKSEIKTRGYFYPFKNSMLMMKCFNCGGLNHNAVPFGKFLQWYDQDAYSEYLMDVFDKPKTKKRVVKSTPEEDYMKFERKTVESKEKDSSIFSSIVPVLDLPVYHYCREYVTERKIPQRWLGNLFFAEQFKTWVNDWLPGKFSPESISRGDTPRLVIALNNENGWTTTVQGRDLTGESFLKYYSIKVAEDEETIFGLDQFDFDKKAYVLEGPIDSMFIDNGLGVGSSSLKIPAKYRAKIKEHVRIYDNEPRNREIVKLIGNSIRAGHQVYLPPENTPYKKDINDWVIETEVTSDEIKTFIDNNTYQGLQAELYFNKWRKV